MNTINNRITKCTIIGITEYRTPEGKVHNTHGPAKSSIYGFAYCQNGKMHNIVGQANRGNYFINDKNMKL